MSVTNCSFNWFVLLFFKEIHLVYFCFLWLLCFCLMLYYVQFSAQFLSKFLNLVFIYFDNFIIIVLIVPPFTFKFKTAHLRLSCIFGISNRYLLFIFFCWYHWFCIDIFWTVIKLLCLFHEAIFFLVKLVTSFTWFCLILALVLSITFTFYCMCVRAKSDILHKLFLMFEDCDCSPLKLRFSLMAGAASSQISIQNRKF